MAIDFPASPVLNQQFSAANSSWVWDGTAWNIVPQMVPAVASDTPPANPAVGQFWWRASNGQLYLYYDDGNSKQWVQAAAPAAAPVTPARAWELIQDIVVTTGVGNYPVANLAPYRRLRFGGEILPSATCQFGFRVSSDNGATWLTTTVYRNTGMAVTTTTVSASDVTASAMWFSAAIDSGAMHTFNVNLENFNAALPTQGLMNMLGQTGSAPYGRTNFMNIAGSTAWNAIQFLATTGTWTGNISLEGVRG